jgi:hypothetical protein
MPSNINFTDIDGNFPKAGVDNPSQGFRDNFTVIKDSLQTAKNEITTLEAITAKVTGDNNFNGNKIQGAKFVNCVEETFTRTTPSESEQVVDYINGTYQEFRLNKDTTFVLQGWPPSDGYAKITVGLVSTNQAVHTATFRNLGTGVIYYDQESAYVRVDENNELIFIDGMKESHSVGQDIKIFEFWSKTAGNAVFARYLGSYNPDGSGGEGLSGAGGSLFINNLEVVNNATMDSNLEVRGVADLQDVTVRGNLIVTGSFAQQVNTTISSISDILDVTIGSNVANGDVLAYNSTLAKWVNSDNRPLVEFAVSIGTYGAQDRDVFYLNGVALETSAGTQRGLKFEVNTKYRFDLSHPSNVNRPLRFSTTPDLPGQNTSLATPYTTGVVASATPAGQPGAFVEITVTSSTPSPLYLYAFETPGVSANYSLIGAGYPIQVSSGGVRVGQPLYVSLGNQNIVVNTTSNPVVIRLPANPSAGMFINIFDSGNAGTNSISIARNGKTINGQTADVVLEVPYGAARLIYDGAGWSYDSSDIIASAVFERIQTQGVNITNNTTSTTPQTGALTVTGGVGVGGRLSVAGLAAFNTSVLLNGIDKLEAGQNVNLQTTTSWFSVGSGQTATLLSGQEGQIKVLIKTNSSGDMTISVANAAWAPTGPGGTIKFTKGGSSCILQFIQGKWTVVGNNDVDLLLANGDPYIPTPVGTVRYDTVNNIFEGWTGSRWSPTIPINTVRYSVSGDQLEIWTGSEWVFINTPQRR